ncbi:hypothetical protein ABZ249_29915 [Nocardiopsis sp. NPDC006139]|uniref:hypothetical protein n=1 Tax=Nocardiopsis sp. NPDC006139 TaxID=3154578 RepID=UPI00339F3D07
MTAVQPGQTYTNASYPHLVALAWYGDYDNHAARTVGVNNRQTACGRWVGERAISKVSRSEPVTCPVCVTALTSEEA